MAIFCSVSAARAGQEALYRPWPQVHLDPLHHAAQPVKPISGCVFQESLVMARDLDPMLSKHFHMLGIKSQEELGGDVVMEQFASPGHYESVLGVGLQLREETVPEIMRPL
jgi:hypothetical protein